MFDLDNTLYPESCGLSDEIEKLMNRFVADYLGVDLAEGTRLRQKAYVEYGTTLGWLQAECQLSDAQPYLDAVHPKNVADFIPPFPDLRHLIESLPQPKVILTNSPMPHAERVLHHLNLRGCFERVYDVTYNDCQGKPHPRAYERVLEDRGVRAEGVLFVDDVPRYLEAFAALGGQCVLVDETNRRPNSPFTTIRHLDQLPEVLEQLACNP